MKELFGQLKDYNALLNTILIQLHSDKQNRMIDIMTNQEKTLESMLKAQNSLCRFIHDRPVDKETHTASIVSSTSSVTALTAFDFDSIIKATAVYKRCISSMPPHSLLEPSHVSAMTYDISEDASDSQSSVDLPAADRARSPSQERIERIVIEVMMQHMVPDRICRQILPEMNCLRIEQRDSSHGSDDEIDQHDPGSKTSSRPKVVLDRYVDVPGGILLRGNSERRKKTRWSSRKKSRSSKDNDSHRIKEPAAAGVAGGVLTAAALRLHDSQNNQINILGLGREMKPRRETNTALWKELLLRFS